MKDVDQARKNIFWRTLKKKKQVIDLSLLPPCKKSLLLHVSRANYISNIWRQSSTAVTRLDEPQNHGWNDNFTLRWCNTPYPDDIAEFLVNQNSNDVHVDDMEEEEDMDAEDDVSDIFLCEDGEI